MHFLSPAMTVLPLAACRDGRTTERTASTAAPPAPASSTPDTTALVTDAGSTLDGLVLRYAAGGANPSRLCEPEWSITNETTTDVPGLMVRIDGQDATGNVLQPVGPFGTPWQNFGAGRRSDRTGLGHPVDCRELGLIVGRYACRDEPAGHMNCRGALRVLTESGTEADVAGIEEGALPGFPGPRS
jgi:hypothetical protein